MAAEPVYYLPGRAGVRLRMLPINTTSQSAVAGRAVLWCRCMADGGGVTPLSPRPGKGRKTVGSAGGGGEYPETVQQYSTVWRRVCGSVPRGGPGSGTVTGLNPSDLAVLTGAHIPAVPPPPAPPATAPLGGSCGEHREGLGGHIPLRLVKSVMVIICHQ